MKTQKFILHVITMVATLIFGVLVVGVPLASADNPGQTVSASPLANNPSYKSTQPASPATGRQLLFQLTCPAKLSSRTLRLAKIQTNSFNQQS